MVGRRRRRGGAAHTVRHDRFALRAVAGADAAALALIRVGGAAAASAAESAAAARDGVLRDKKYMYFDQTVITEYVQDYFLEKGR